MRRKFCCLCVLLVLGLVLGCSGSSTQSGVNVSSDEVKDLQKSTHGDLIRAVLIGDEARVHSLLDTGTDINESFQIENHGTITPLLAAAVSRNSKLTGLLIRNKASNAPTFDGYTARDFLYYYQDEQNAELINQFKK